MNGLKEHLKRIGLMQVDLARSIDMDPTTLNKYVTGRLPMPEGVKAVVSGKTGYIFEEPAAVKSETSMTKNEFIHFLAKEFGVELSDGPSKRKERKSHGFMDVVRRLVAENYTTGQQFGIFNIQYVYASKFKASDEVTMKRVSRALTQLKAKGELDPAHKQGVYIVNEKLIERVGE